MNLKLGLYNTIDDFGLSLVFFNAWVYVYLLYAFFSIFFLFDIKIFNTLNCLKNLGKLGFVSISSVMVVFSIAGIPPLAGFITKFLILNFLFFKQFYFFVLLFSFVNFFAMYFYMQCLRFMVSKTQTNFFLILKNKFFLNRILVNLVVLLNLVNFFGILFLEDLFYWFYNLIVQKAFF